MSTDTELAKSFNRDVVERYARHFVDVLRTCLSGLEGPKRALDLACGTGYGTVSILEMLPAGSTIVALCEDRYALKEFHNILDADLRTRILPHKETSKRLPFAPATFDLVFACLPHRLWEPPRPVIREALRVLRSGGLFAVALPLNGSFLELRAAIRSSENQQAHPTIKQQSTGIAQLVDPDEWIKLIEKAGGKNATVKRSTFALAVAPPLSKDRLMSRHLLPLWLGGSPLARTNAALDAALTESLVTTVHVGCIVTERAATD